MTQFEEYAKLLVEVGVNIQKGQNLVISSPVDCAWFVRLCAKAAYDAGCREVINCWDDDELSREKGLRAADDVFDTVPAWRVDMLTGYARGGAAFLRIAAEDPENLKGVDPDRLLRLRRASGKALEEYRRLTMTNAVAWSIGSIPIPSWARKVFPGRVEEESMEKLWDAIFAAVRVTGDMVGETMFYGPGAGKLPTASAMVGDLVTALTQPAGSRPLAWGPEKPGALQPWEESIAQRFLRVSGMDREELETFYPGCRFLDGPEEGETALITAPATQGELDAAGQAAQAAGGRILSRITLLEDNR